MSLDASGHPSRLQKEQPDSPDSPGTPRPSSTKDLEIDDGFTRPTPVGTPRPDRSLPLRSSSLSIADRFPEIPWPDDINYCSTRPVPLPEPAIAPAPAPAHDTSLPPPPLLAAHDTSVGTPQSASKPTVSMRRTASPPPRKCHSNSLAACALLTVPH